VFKLVGSMRTPDEWSWIVAGRDAGRKSASSLPVFLPIRVTEYVRPHGQRWHHKYSISTWVNRAQDYGACLCRCDTLLNRIAIALILSCAAVVKRFRPRALRHQGQHDVPDWGWGEGANGCQQSHCRSSPPDGEE
jgi:hypothetical protein